MFCKPQGRLVFHRYLGLNCILAKVFSCQYVICLVFFYNLFFFRNTFEERIFIYSETEKEKDIYLVYNLESKFVIWWYVQFNISPAAKTT